MINKHKLLFPAAVLSVAIAGLLNTSSVLAASEDASITDNAGVTAASRNELVSTRPSINDGPNKNPLKGFNSGWWNPGQEDWASIGYQAIEWRDFERCVDENGQALRFQTYERCNNNWDWAEIERTIERAGSSGRHIVLQLVLDLPGKAEEVDAPTGIVTRRQGYAGPEWLRSIGGERVDPNRPGYSATNYDDLFIQEQAVEAIQALVSRYGDDPRVFIIQTGILGFYGEWQTYPYDGQVRSENPQGLDWSPSPATMDNILGTYLSELNIASGLRALTDFTGTYTQVRYPNQEANVAREGPGIGYVNGYVVQTRHGEEFGEEIGDPERQLWKNGPIGGEWPPSNKETLTIENADAEQECKENRPGDTRNCWELFLDEDGEEFIRNGHYTHVLPPENPERRVDITAAGWKGDSRFMRLHKLFGYNFQVEEVRHSATTSGYTYVEVDLGNVGIAPFYGDWDLELAVLDATTKDKVGSVVVDTDIRALGPDEKTTVSATIDAQTVSGGAYEIALRIQQPNELLAAKLDPRNLYVVLANDVDVVDGAWDNDALVGGWNILDDLQLSNVGEPLTCGGLPVTIVWGLGASATRGDDVIMGTPNADTINGRGGNDVICGNAGNDRISGALGNDTIYGGAGNDRLVGGLGDDTLYGGNGQDLLAGGRGNDALNGGEGNDRLIGGPNSDLLYGDGGDDRLFGGDGTDLCDGGDTNETVGDRAARTCENVI